MTDTDVVDEKPNPQSPAPNTSARGGGDDHHQFSKDQTLSTEFVEAVAAAVNTGEREMLVGHIQDLHPADTADLIGLLDTDARDQFLRLTVDVLKPETLAELDEDLRAEVIEAIGPERVAEALGELETDDAAFVIEDLDEEKRAEILADVPVEERIAVRAALDYPEESAGRVMQRDFFAAPGYWNVGQIIDRLRSAEELPDNFYEVFVVDPSFRPIGYVPLSALLKSPRDAIIEKIMSAGDFRKIPVMTDQEEVAYLFEQYNLISTPVVDESQRLVGMITVDDVVEMVRDETHEDMLALAGVEADTGLSDSVTQTVRSRFSWLAVNLLTAIGASLVISLFDKAIGQVVALAVLMPIVASMGGNAGTQTLTVAVRSLATKDLTAANAARIIYREAAVGFCNGVIFAAIMGLLAGIWFYASGWGDQSQALRLGGVVAVAMVINLLAAGLAGILVPLGLQRAGADPAVSSAVFVTTITDILGFFVFLALAALVLLPAV